MGLNLHNGGGDFTPHIRFMASTSSWRMSAEGGPVDFDFTQAVFDLDQIKTGWCCIAEGEAPEWVMDASLEQPAAKPTDGRDWKRGFKVDVFSPKMFGDEQPVRELGTNATGACMGIQALYADYESQVGKNAGKVPVVKFNGATPTKVGKGNTNVPKLEIDKWVDRPADLPIEDNQKSAQQSEPAQAAAAPVDDDDDEF